jgi:hypothetical protein
MAEASVPKEVIDFEDINREKGAYSQSMLYSQSKAGNIFLGWEFARRTREERLISVVRCFTVQHTDKGIVLDWTNLLVDFESWKSQVASAALCYSSSEQIQRRLAKVGPRRGIQS